MEFNNNFKLTKTLKIEEIKGTAYMLEHKKTKAQILFINNNDINKSFLISFNTPCENSKGIPHILEHSLLMGSKNYKVKDPFINLIKKSNANFLNAFTFPDKTGYAICSRNATEISNLQKVYLDAVFYPNVTKDEKIFLQEGWRHEINNNKLKYSGVVYAEMKGATSDPDEQINIIIKKNLLKGTHLQHYSGGDPKEILTLTHQELIKFYNKYYHPSNSYTYYYGNFTQEQINLQLQTLNNYLKNFKQKELNFTTKTKKKTLTKNINLKQEYTTNEKDTTEKTYITKALLGPTIENPQKTIGFLILINSLFNLNSSPLKKEILKNQLCHNFDATLEFDDIYQSYFSLTLHNSETTKQEKFEKIYKQTLKQIKTTGLNKNLLKSALNQIEFYFREMPEQNEYTYGLLYWIFLSNTYLRNIKNLGIMQYNKIFDNLKKEIDNKNSNYFNNLLEEYLLNNKELNLIYSPKYSNQDKEEKELEKKQKQLTNQEIENIKQQNEQMKQFQSQQDTIEEIEKIKTIELSQIEKLPPQEKITDITTQQQHSKFDKIIYYENNTKGISYINFYFNNNIISQKHIPYLAILEDILNEVKTKNYNYDEFSNQIDIYTGGISFNNFCYKDQKKNTHFKMVVSCKTLNRNFEKGIQLLNEYFNNVIFEENKILEILKKVKNNMKTSFINNGYNLVFSRLKSYFNQTGQINEQTHGLEYYNFLENLIKNYDNEKTNLLNTINQIYKKIFNSHNLIIALNCEKENKNKNLEILKHLKINNYIHKENNYKFNPENKTEGIHSQTLVNYVGLGFNLEELNFKYTGKLLAIKHLLRYGFLWKEIREKGGAYGIIIDINTNADFLLCSYRDPNIETTYKTFNKIPEILQKTKLSQTELKNLIIGTLTKFDTFFNPQVQGNIAFSNYLKGINYEILKQEREDILNLTNDDINLIGNILELALSNAKKCAFGTKKLIEKSHEFQKIKKI